MELTEEQKNFQNDLARALHKAWESNEFKNKFIESPLDAIEELTGSRPQFKSGSKMIVVDQSEANTFYFNIPAKPNTEDVELTDDQLEHVAGGDFGNWLLEKAARAIVIASPPLVAAYKLTKI